MKFEHTQVFNFEGALRGMRNPKNSWHLNDSQGYVYANVLGQDFFKPEEHHVLHYEGNDAICFEIGPKDMKLAKALIHGGPEHRKFLRQIFVSVDITAPLYW